MEKSPNYTFDDFTQIEVAGGPVWDAKHPDVLYFMSDVSGNYQIYRTEVCAGHSPWPTRLTYTSDRTTTPKTTPNGGLIYLLDKGGDEKWQVYYMADPQSKVSVPLTNKMDSIHRPGPVDERYLYLASNREKGSRFDLYRLDYTTGAIELLLENPTDGILHPVDLSPDRTKLLVREDRSNVVKRLHLFDLETKTLHEVGITQREPGFWSPYVFVSDDKILCTTDVEGREFRSLALLSIVDDSVAFLEDDQWDSSYVQFHKDTRQVIWEKNVDGFSELFVGELTTDGLENKRQLPLPSDGKSVVKAGDYRTYTVPARFSPSGQSLAVTVESAIDTSNVWVIPLDSPSKAWQLTKASTGKIPSSVFVDTSLERVKSFDGLEFSSFLFLPKTEDKKVPCVVIIHGGPEAQSLPTFNPLVQYLLHKGYAVSVPNVRGSTGYGRTFEGLDNIGLRLNSVGDIKALADSLKTHPRIAPDKLVVYGGSYGGYMVLAAITEFPTLFAAAVDIVGIANFVTFLENTAPWRRKIREVEYGSLENDRGLLEEISPIRKADEIQTPLLIIHGKNDERVPVSEAEAIYERLQTRSVPVEKLIFEDEGHGIVKRENRLRAYQKVTEFLEGLGLTD